MRLRKLLLIGCVTTMIVASVLTGCGNGNKASKNDGGSGSASEGKKSKKLNLPANLDVELMSRSEERNYDGVWRIKYKSTI